MSKIIDSTNLVYLISKIKAAFWPKSDVIQIGLDATPTNNSDNLVKSGGVKSALDAKQDTITSTNKLDYSLIDNTPTIPATITESTVSGWGFTKNTGTLTSETDPVFSASAAAGITSSDITNWNSKTSNTGTLTGVKFNNVDATVSNGVASISATIPAAVTESTVAGWGFTKNSGTLTSETDPVFTASVAHGISSTDISNWNAKQKAITISSSEPTSSQGSDGDIWIVI